MILRRPGNKSKVAEEIQKQFPYHNIYVEPFFGAGGMFFNKPKVKYNIVNDLDSDVFNLFQVISNKKEEFKKAFEIMPVHSDLLKYWKENIEIDPIKKALRFLFLSNFTLMANGCTITYGTENAKGLIYDRLNKCNELLFDVQFYNGHFKDFFKILRDCQSEQTFIYADPPYLGTWDNYETSFKEQDANDLFDCLIETGAKFAYSEFDNPFILEQAEKRGLNIITLKERRNFNNRRTEILVTNYKKPLSLFDGV